MLCREEKSICVHKQCCGDKPPREEKGRKTTVQVWGSHSWLSYCRPVNKQGEIVGYGQLCKAEQGIVTRKLRKGEEER